MRRGGLLIAVLALSLVAGASIARTETVEEFYKGKTLTIVVGSDVGGGYDTNARLLSRHIGKFIPGNPAVVVQNRPGGGSIIAANYIYNAAPKDGTTIGMVQRGIPLWKLTAQPGVQYDPEKYNWIGNMSAEVSVIAVWQANSPVAKVEDLYTKELVVGGSGAGGENETCPRLLNTVLGTKFKVVSGYKSQTEVLLAMERGEVIGNAGLSWPTLKTNKADELKAGKYKVLLQNGLKRDKDLPNIPLSLEFAKSAADKQALEFYFTQNTVARPIMAPPGVPADRVAALRAAVMAMAKDQAFRDDAAKIGLDTDPMAGDEVQRIVEKLVQTPAEVVARVAAATNPNAK
jgi:tripartite-type tricarboxylate transporter receptor subunit TctC